ncbi:hypothetical protein CYLTODRAFT_494955 [Cylindrobasidium torrendii FP15055 ss-10]|uniref:Uncharacterized protein n=1 Tax=Cylindrobasidium torrendii FP15055 ss-10 TaxID=1314674 RepID=A0A0D7AVS9_9AGAR|nr:hypothetical protein CYLTODRAFT_494955 [Cylindrobasidium torrendii FP15055 ss-10]
MARPRKYQTDDQRRQAQAVADAKYYASHRRKILKQKKSIYRKKQEARSEDAREEPAKRRGVVQRTIIPREPAVIISVAERELAFLRGEVARLQAIQGASLAEYAETIVQELLADPTNARAALKHHKDQVSDIRNSAGYATGRIFSAEGASKGYWYSRELIQVFEDSLCTVEDIMDACDTDDYVLHSLRSAHNSQSLLYQRQSSS